MSDELNGQVEQNLEGKPETVMPTEEKNQAELEQQLIDASLPEGVSDRTKREFEKLKNKNKELAEKLKALEAAQVDESSVEQAASSGDYANLSKEQIRDIAQDLFDADGYLDERKFNEVLRAANSRAEEAILIAKKATEKLAKFEHRQQQREAYALFPQLDPYSQDFDDRFHRQVVLELKNMKPSERDLLQAAKNAKAFFDGLGVAIGKPKTVNPAREERKQAAAEPGHGKASLSELTDEELIRGTIKGDSEAIAERLKRLEKS